MGRDRHAVALRQIGGNLNGGLAVGAAGAVGDAHKVRPQRCDGLRRGGHRGKGGVRLRGKDLKGQRQGFPAE